MNFELLPNEVILDIFGYIDSANLVAFYGLNARFKNLIDKQYRSHCFTFIGCSNENFERICQQHLPFLLNQVSYLNLGDFSETPGQMDLFFSYFPSISSFTSLKTFKFHRLQSDSILIRIIKELPHLIHLTHLAFHSCYSQCSNIFFQLIIDKIWNLPKLISLYFDIYFKKVSHFVLPTNVSTSIKHLHIYKYLLAYHEIKQLNYYTPYLKHAKIFFKISAYEHLQISEPLRLTDLSICSRCSSDTSKMMYLLQYLPNLRRLYVSLSGYIINGYQWEQLIETYLPKLKIITLIMFDQWGFHQTLEVQADQLLDSFRSSFWIDKHKWFVQCLVYNQILHLETLPSPPQYLDRNFPCLWKSTHPNDDFQKYLNTITNISYPTSFQPLTPSSIHLTNIHFLIVIFPIIDEFWSFVPTLKHLKSLEILAYNDSFCSQLQILLDQAYNLTLLSIRESESLPLQTSLFQCKSTSIRSLNLIDYNYQFDEEECLTLSHSSLALQCEILSIRVKNSQSIVILIEHMIHLKALHVHQNQFESSEEYTSHMKEIIQWLKEHLPSTCLITQEFQSMNSLRIWIK